MADDLEYNDFSVFASGSLDDVKKIINTCNFDLDTAFEYACSGGNLDVVKFLINIWDFDLDTAFYYACSGGNLDVVKFLIEKGCDSLREGFIIACREGHLDIVKLIIAKGVCNWSNGIYFAGLKGNRDIVDLILKESNGNIGNNYDIQNLLIISVKHGWMDLILNTMYKVNMHSGRMGHKQTYIYRFDILNVYKKEYKSWYYVEEKMVDVKVKLFDLNLFK
jgi:ankyrin repeat protein